MRLRTLHKGQTSRVSVLTIAASAVLTLTAPEWAPAQELNGRATVTQNSLSLTQESLRSALRSRRSNTDSNLRSGPGSVEAFYASRDYYPVWSGTSEANRAAAAARSILADADRQGLDSSAYMSSALERDETPSAGRGAALYDIALTEAVLRYAHDLHTGRVRPKDVYADVGLPQSDFDPATGLAAAVRGNSVEAYLNDLAPMHPDYRHLVEALNKYRNIAKQGGWPSVAGAGNGKGLAARLAAEDSALVGKLNPSSAELSEAVKRYQIRNGLKADGQVGSETLASLNVPVSARIQQIVANMERWRWLPAHLERRYISINVPDQSLEFVMDDKVLLNSRVAVGKKTTPTPILRTVSESLIANPPWNVPSDIAARQLLPNLKRNPNYLAAHNMVVVDGPSGDPRGATINWDSIPAGQFPYQVQQRPGPASAMGIVMLDSPNDFDVYLHDTPGKKPFEDDERGISNGCIRVQQIMPLASLALTNDTQSGLSQVNNAISSHETQRIPLSEPIPIYMLYWTAVADAEGNVGFRNDRYDRDPPLIRALGNTVVASR